MPMKSSSLTQQQETSGHELYREALRTRRFERRYSRIFWVATLAVTAMIVLIAIAFVVARLMQ